MNEFIYQYKQYLKNEIKFEQDIFTKEENEPLKVNNKNKNADKFSFFPLISQFCLNNCFDRFR